MTASTSRTMWQQYEPIHDLTYFAPEPQRVAADLGLRGFWMAYFAMRAAPLGGIGPEPVGAIFFGFHRRRVHRALPDAWSYASPEDVLDARLRGVDLALRAVLGDTSIASPQMSEAADLAWLAAQATDTAGRPLAAANKALPRPAQPHLALWQATTVLREHRGDGHHAILVARGWSPARAHLMKVAAGETDEAMLRAARGFETQEWDEARQALIAAKWLTVDGDLTEAAAVEHAIIERLTDSRSEAPWEALGAARSQRLLELIRPVTRAIARTGLIPALNPVGHVRSNAPGEVETMTDDLP